MFKRKAKMKVEQPDFELDELPFPIMSMNPEVLKKMIVECRHVWVLGEMDDKRKMRICVHCKAEHLILHKIECSCPSSEWGTHHITCPRLAGGYVDGYPRYQ